MKSLLRGFFSVASNHFSQADDHNEDNNDAIFPPPSKSTTQVLISDIDIHNNIKKSSVPGFNYHLTSIKILQSRLAKPVTHQIHTKLPPVPMIPVSNKSVTYKQLIQTAKQSQPLQVPKSIIKVQQRPPEKNHLHCCTHR